MITSSVTGYTASVVSDQIELVAGVQSVTFGSATDVQLVENETGVLLYWLTPTGALIFGTVNTDLSISNQVTLVPTGVTTFFARFLPGVGTSFAYVVGTVLTINIAGTTTTGTWSADRLHDFSYDVSGDLQTITVLYRQGEPSQAYSESYSAMVKAEAPVFTPGSGTYQGVQSILISSNTAGAVIHYTIDGSEPTDASPVASAAVSISSDVTIRAIAVAAGFINSDISSASYIIQLAPLAVAPVFNPVAGAYTTAINVAITSTTPNRIIRYTLDGSAPTMSSPIYTSPIPVSADVVIRAFATAAGYRPSPVSTASYTITIAPPTPEAHVDPIYSRLKLYDFQMGLRELSAFAQDYSV